MITRTPAPPEACPTTLADLTFEAPAIESQEAALQQVYDFLNSGGSVEALALGLEQAWDSTDYYQLSARTAVEGYPQSAHSVEDLTGDGVTDTLLFLSHANLHSLQLLKCVGGQYAVVYREDWPIDESDLAYAHSIQDVNGNGTRELLFDILGGHGAYHSEGMAVYEWDGRTLVRVLEATGLNVRVDVEILDVNLDGASEFRVSLGPPYECVSDPPSWLPYRKEILTYSWNGAQYVEIGHEFAVPEYRFLMVYAGDEAAAAGDYGRALDYYQQAISNESLKSASADLWGNLEESCTRLVADTPEPSPTPQAQERPNLEAYSRFRLVLLHLLRGDHASASAEYDELQGQFRPGIAGHAYAEMANVFWEEYGSSSEVGLACSKVREFAFGHPAETLSPLGIDFYGMGGQEYQPEDVCPFS